MASRLDCIKNWDSLVVQGNYRVELLAGSCGVTERQLRRYFKIRFGISPHAWIRAKRMEQAKSLLSNGKLVKDAAAEVGFLLPSNFARQFKRQYQTTPTALRQS